MWFWTNHFTISLHRGQCAAVAAAFVEEAIRPHVTGRFSDMVLAVMRHPAMLLYLDNTGSFGPDSLVGQRTHRGLNENLARECMELHTVSPLAGYTQADVTSFAKILTGWSIELKADPPGFRYRPFAHEPGVQTVMRQQFPPDEAGGVAALAFLANHPATHRFLATKLVRHFVADDPPPDAVRTIEAVLRDTRATSARASAALVHSGRRLAARNETAHADGIRDRQRPRAGRPARSDAQHAGHPGRPRPTAVDRARAERLAGPCRRLGRARGDAAPDRLGSGFAGRIGDRDVVEIADAASGPLLRPETREAIRRAGSRRDAMTLLLTSPEFQRR